MILFSYFSNSLSLLFLSLLLFIGQGLDIIIITVEIFSYPLWNLIELLLYVNNVNGLNDAVGPLSL